MNSQLAHGPASGMFSLPTPQCLATLNALEKQTKRQLVQCSYNPVLSFSSCLIIIISIPGKLKNLMPINPKSSGQRAAVQVLS